MLDFSVVIATYNGANRVGTVLERLRSQHSTHAFTWEVVVVDNNSVDNTSAAIAAYQADFPVSLRYVFEAQQGLAFARSRGIREAQGRWVAFLDDDNLPAEDWLFQAHQFTQAHPHIGAFNGQIHAAYEVEPPPDVKKVAVFLAIVERGSTPHRYDRVLPPGAGLVVKRQVWLDHVPQNLVLVGRTSAAMLASEDIEAILHIQKAGWEIWYNPEMHLDHQIPAWRTERSYLLKLVRGMGLARHHIRMMRWQRWQRPAITLMYGLNDVKNILLFKLKRHDLRDLRLACEWELLISSLISPLYLWRHAKR